MLVLNINEYFIVQDPLLMYPGEAKKIGQVKSATDEKNCEFYYSRPAPLPPPRHKRDTVKTSNLIDL